MDIIDEDEPANVYADNQILDCDMPAAHKLSGTAGHSHDMHPCLYCDTDITKINTREGYDYSSTFFMRDSQVSMSLQAGQRQIMIIFSDNHSIHDMPILSGRRLFSMITEFAGAHLTSSLAGFPQRRPRSTSCIAYFWVRDVNLLTSKADEDTRHHCPSIHACFICRLYVLRCWR